ncbi:hypothetical protein [uncultured Mediterranean phage]|nr:hypothetical protein [uncultured Mediterranean phage]
MAQVDFGAGEIFAKIAAQRRADDEAAAIRDQEGVQSAKNIGSGTGAVIGGALGALTGNPAAIAAGASTGADWGGKIGGAAAGDEESMKGMLMSALRSYGATYIPIPDGDAALDVVGATMGGA